MECKPDNPIGSWVFSGSRMDIGGSHRRKVNGGTAPRTKVRGTSAGKPRKGLPSRNGDGDHLAFTIPSDYEMGHDVRRQILTVAEKCGFRGENFFALNLALEEALVNAIKHGNRLDPLKVVRVEAHVSHGRAEVTIEDQGVGFERCKVPDPTADENLHRCSGRGILLIETYMSEVKWDHGGRRLHMVRENK